MVVLLATATGVLFFGLFFIIGRFEINLLTIFYLMVSIIIGIDITVRL